MEKCLKRFLTTTWAWHSLPRLDSPNSVSQLRIIRANEIFLRHMRIYSKNGPVHIADKVQREVRNERSSIELNAIDSQRITMLLWKVRKDKYMPIKKIPYVLPLLLNETHPKLLSALKQLLCRLNEHIPFLSVTTLTSVYQHLGKYNNNYKILKLCTYILACLENKLLDFIRLNPIRNVRCLLEFCIFDESNKLAPIVMNVKGNHSQNELVLYYTLMFKALLEFPSRPHQIMKLYDSLQKQLLPMVQSCTLLDTYNILESLSRYISTNYHQSYNQDLIKALVTAIVAHKVSDKAFIQMVMMLNKMRYTNTNITDELAERLHRNIKLLQSNFYAGTWPLLYSMNVANHKPPCWNSLEEIICDQINELYHHPSLPICLATYLFSLGCYLPELFITILNNHNFINDRPSSKLLYLWRGLKQFYPQFFVDYQCTFKNIPDEESPHLQQLESWLTDRIGGPHYVKMNMYTKLGYLVDCVMVIRSGGYPIAISNEDNENVTFVEDIKLGPNNQGVIILCWPKWAFASNTGSLQSIRLLQVRTIEQSTGFSVIVLNKSTLYKLTDAEKMLHLMSAIKERCAVLDFEYI